MRLAKRAAGAIGPRPMLLFLTAFLGACFLSSHLGPGSASAGEVPPTIELFRAGDQLGSIRALFDDEPTYSSLEAMIERAALWHIGSSVTSEGSGHTFYFHGQKRNSTRHLTLSCRVQRTPVGYRISPVVQAFEFLSLQGHPFARNPTELAILRAAFNDPGVIEVVERFTAQRSIQSICLQPEAPGGGYRLSFLAPAPLSEPPYTVSGEVREDSSTGTYRFIFD